MADRPAATPPKIPGRVTPAYLQRATLAYLERFASSVDNLRRVLKRKVETRCRRRGEEAEPYLPLIDEVVARAVASGLVDDRRFAEGRVATLRRRGGSARLIAARLAAKGVDRDVIAAALADEPEDERAAAFALARRRRIGPYRIGDRTACRDKDLAVLARAGFSYTIAKAVVDAAEDD